MQIKAVLFDMFDTLTLIDNDKGVYPHAIDLMHKYITKQGIDVTFEQFQKAYSKARNDLDSVANKTLEEPHFNQRVQTTLQLLGHNLDSKNPIITGATEEFFQYLLNRVKLDENAKTVLQNLRGNYKLGIVSNYAISDGVHSVLKANAIDELFDIVVISCDVNIRKPSPEIFQIALKKMGVLAENTVFVGDRAYPDVAGAHATGIKAVYINRRADEDLEKFTPDVIIESLTELPDALKTISQKY